MKEATTGHSYNKNITSRKKEVVPKGFILKRFGNPTTDEKVFL